jgi:N6-adenosine-specific RNA methylase IME4
MEYKKHKFNIFPEMQSDDFERLKSDLQKNNFDSKQPIYLYENEILDGWNRQRACLLLNIIPVYKDFIGNDTDAINFVMRTNKRRNLNSSQWACIACEADEIIKAISKQVEEERREKISETRKEIFAEKIPEIFESKKQISQLIDESKINEKRTDTKIAEMFNTNRTYVSEAAKFKKNKPEVFEQVKSGLKTLTEVKKEEKIQQRTELIEKQKKQIAENIFPELTGLYDIISIDPPWNYGREYDPENSRVANPYPEMTVEEIKAINLPFTDNAIIFLWATHKFLPDSFEILKHWGFEYKATLVWNKEKMGVGAWFRMQCEFCLFAIKGKPIFHNTTERDIIIESRREHSRKPDVFFEMVNKICVGRKLEYFGREKREGWDIFGNDINKFNEK